LGDQLADFSQKIVSSAEKFGRALGMEIVRAENGNAGQLALAGVFCSAPSNTGLRRN
jgi:hypothetical protein